MSKHWTMPSTPEEQKAFLHLLETIRNMADPETRKAREKEDRDAWELNKIQFRVGPEQWPFEQD